VVLAGRDIVETLGTNTLAQLQQYLDENYPHDVFSSAARVAEVWPWSTRPG